MGMGSGEATDGVGVDLVRILAAEQREGGPRGGAGRRVPAEGLDGVRGEAWTRQTFKHTEKVGREPKDTRRKKKTRAAHRRKLGSIPIGERRSGFGFGDATDRVGSGLIPAVAGEGPRVHCVRDGDNAALGNIEGF